MSLRGFRWEEVLGIREASVFAEFLTCIAVSRNANVFGSYECVSFAYL